MAKQSPKTHKTEKPSGQQTVWLDHDQGTVYYANTIEVTGNLWDVRLRIGEIIKADEGELVMRERAKIFISPQQAVALNEILERNITRYEEQFGPIPRAKKSK